MTHMSTGSNSAKWWFAEGVITKGVFSLEESLESLISQNFRETLGNGRLLLYFPQSLSKFSKLSRQWTFLQRPLFQKTPFSEQCQKTVVFIVDDLGFFGPGIPDLVTELCPSQNTA